MGTSDSLDPPTRSKGGDVVATSTEAVLSAIPIIGGPLAVVVATLFA